MDHPFNRDLQNVLDADEAYDFLPEGSCFPVDAVCWRKACTD